MSEPLTGAQAMLQTLDAGGVEVCFANPGTSEMHFVAALDRSPMRAVLALFEGVAAGAADGYARMKCAPACVLLHLGSGLSNASAHLHNARRARSPLINVVGDHASHHLRHDAPLTSDIDMLARPVSDWVRRVAGAGDAGPAAALSVHAAKASGVATLILPADAAWDEGGAVGKMVPHTPRRVDEARVEATACRLGAARRTGLLLSGAALHGAGLEAAGRIAAATGADLLSITSPARLESGAGRPIVTRIPYFAEHAAALLGCYTQLILVGAAAPAAFFAYPGKLSTLAAPHCDISLLAAPDEDIVGALLDLAEALSAPRKQKPPSRPPLPEQVSGALTPSTAAAVIARAAPESAIIVDEGFTAGVATTQMLASAAPHDHLFLTGGAIGIGLPLALGAAVACEDRRVIVLQGDGSALYAIQALWSHARERAKVTTVIFVNRAYAILDIELQRVGARGNGAKAASLLSLDNPALGWVSIARGLGVPAMKADTAEALARALDSALAENGPFLIEANISASAPHALVDTLATA